jgi:hypothetical protein
VGQGAASACSPACALNLKQGSQPDGPAHFRVHMRGGGRTLPLAKCVAAGLLHPHRQPRTLQGQYLPPPPCAP